MYHLYSNYLNLAEKTSFQPLSMASHFFIFHDLIANNTMRFQHKAICLLEEKNQKPGALCVLDINFTNKEMHLLWQVFWFRVRRIPREKNEKKIYFYSKTKKHITLNIKSCL